MNRLSFLRLAHCCGRIHLTILALLLAPGAAFADPFTTPTNYVVGSNPASLCLGNLRGNNYVRDLAVANFGDNTVSVRLCLDDGAFGSVDTYAVGLQPAAVRYGDFNRDGQDDLVTANSGTNTVSVLINLGVGANFRAATNFVVGTSPNAGPRDIRPADINGDGRTDLVVAVPNDNCISVLTNRGNGVFGGLVNYSLGAGSGPVSVWVADLNLDGLPDIVAVSTNGTYSILLGTGGGAFAAPETENVLPAGSPLPVGVIAEDINKDNVVDLVIANARSNSVTVIEGRYNGFDWIALPQFDYELPNDGSAPSGILVRDLNHDGIKDIAVSCSSDANVWVYTGNGNATFAEPPTGVPAGSGNSSAIGGSNFNGDGATDLVTANYSGNNVSVFLYAAPVAQDVTASVNEDTPTIITLRGALLGGGSQFVTLTAPAHGTLSGPTTNLLYSPETNYFGADSFTFATVDPGNLTTSAVATVTLTVQPVNDAPRFDLAVASVSVLEDSPLTNFPGLIASAFTGTNEGSQTYAFITTTPSNAFFASRPTISPTGTLTFRPAVNRTGTVPVFVQMRDSGGTLRGGVSLSTTQTFNVVVTPSPIKPLRGFYNGLFYETNGVHAQAAGFFTFTMMANGTFSGRLTSDLGRDAFTGRFDLTGRATVLINRANNSNVGLTLQLDVNGGSDQVTGSISDGNWTAGVFGDRVGYSAPANPAPQVGRYTLALAGAANAALAPGGAGFALLTVSTAGKVTASGKLGDGTSFAQATSLSKNGQWPFYARPYVAGQGVIIGWVNFTNRLTSSLEGSVSWVKTLLGGAYYPLGFTTTNTVIGSTYTPPGIGDRVLALTNAAIVYRGGNLSGGLTNLVSFTETNTVYSVDLSGLDSMFRLNSAAFGTVLGNFVHPGAAARKSFYGVVLQQQNTAQGYFFGPTAETGSFLLRAD